MYKLTCHLHIGMPKTGTSSIQHTLSRIDLGALRYLPFENNNHSVYFANLFENAPWRHRSNTMRNRSREDVLRRKNKLEMDLAGMLQNAAEDPAIRGVIWSGERLANLGKTRAASVARLRDFFEPWCDAFQVYGYARPLASLMPSDFQQKLRAGVPPVINFDALYPRYRDRFEKHDIVFGRAHVSLRRFAADTLAGGDAVLDFAAQLGIRVAPGDIVRTNETLSREATAILFALRRAGYLGDGSLDATNKIRETAAMLRGLTGGRLAFDPAASAGLIDRNERDITWIERRIGAPVSDPPAPNDRPVRHDRDLLDIAADARHRIAELLPVAPDYPGAVPPQVLLDWVEEGLVAA